MNKQKNYRRRQRGITPITTPRNSPGVAQFSMSEVAQFSVSLDKAYGFIPKASGERLKALPRTRDCGDGFQR